MLLLYISAAELGEGETATAEEQPGEAKKEPSPVEESVRRERKRWKPPETITQPCSDFIKRQNVKEVKRG